jgi:hypothetical protein
MIRSVVEHGQRDESLQRVEPVVAKIGVPCEVTGFLSRDAENTRSDCGEYSDGKPA